MEFSWWLVLLAGFAGWCIGYEKLRNSLSNLSRLFTRGNRTDLSTLLPDHNDQVERDLELNNLLEQYAVDDNSVELYLTLGDAFRRRGEYSRAIGVHEHLLSRGRLSNDQQRNIKLELARDYAGAGLLDRVEALLEPLVKADPNDAAAQASNGGALPPDLSVIVAARGGGADYLYNLLIAYETPKPDDVELTSGLHYNPVMDGGKISMAAPLSDGLVEYADGTPATVKQMAADVTEFLAWSADPKMEQRKGAGLMTMIYLTILAILLWFSYKRVWKDVDH